MAEDEGPVQRRRAPGRRRLNADQARENRVVVKCTDDEFSMLFGMAAAQNISIQNVLMRAVLSGGTESAARTSELVFELQQTRRLFSVATGLLNQLATVANSTGEMPAQVPELLTMMERGSGSLQEFLDGLSERFGTDGRQGRL